jgi:ribosomal protein S18 acetylase RimI-like enzyme
MHQHRRSETVFVIRQAVNEDADRLAALRVEFYQTQIAAGWRDQPLNLQESMQAGTPATIRSPRNCIFLAEIAGEPIGYVFGTTKIVPGVRDPIISSIEEMYVGSDYRGVSLARRLLQNALADFRARNADRIQLRILAENSDARMYWSQLGFRENVIICEFEQDHRGSSAPT